MNLLELENQFKESYAPEKIQSELESGFFNLINNPENIEIKNELTLMLQNELPLLAFSGISIFVLNATKRIPFFLARLDIYRASSNKLIAWYNIEYGMQGDILDDYFDFY